MRKLLTLVFALLAGPVFAQNMGQVGGLNVPAAAGSSGTVTSVACPNTTITTTGACNPLASGGISGDVVTSSGTNTIQDSGTALTTLAPKASPTFTGTVTVPVTGSAQCLQVNTSGAIAGSGGPCGGSVPGSNQQVIFNNAGAFGASAGFSINTAAEDYLTLGTASAPGGLIMFSGSTGATTIVPTPSASNRTITFPDASMTVAGINVAQTFTAAQTNSTGGAASTPALLLSGAILSGGSGTTNVPNFLIQPTAATPATSWSTSGTPIGVNIAVAAGNFLDFRVNGASVFSIGASGNLFAGAALSAGAATQIGWSGRGQLTSPAAGAVQFGNADTAAPVAQTLSMQSVVAGTSNTAGANALITGSRSTGSGAGGSITLQTSLNTAATTTQNTLANVLTLDSVQHGTFGNTGAPPTCGAGCASISATSTDQRMVVTTGTAATSVVVNFGKTWINAPVCVSETASATNLSGITAISASSVTIGVATALTTAPIYIVCG